MSQVFDAREQDQQYFEGEEAVVSTDSQLIGSRSGYT